MIELGQLERRHEDFARQKTRVIAVSLEAFDDARKTQRDFPHLLVLSDHGRGLSEAVELVHPHGGRFSWHEDSDYPTTILVDRNGTVRWLHRSSVIERPSPDELLKVIDEYIPPAERGGSRD
jgi:peroxiredoxin